MRETPRMRTICESGQFSKSFSWISRTHPPSLRVFLLVELRKEIIIPENRIANR